MGDLDPRKPQKRKVRVQPEILRRLEKNGWNTVMDEYEAQMLSHIAFPEDIEETVDDIGGCANVKEAMDEIFVLPMLNPNIFEEQKLLRPPKGILFFGEPGTGKTMMARAICKSSGSIFFNIRMSAIQSKWFGDSTKLIRGLFSLAHKLAPSVIFVDEMDGFLHSRGMGGDHDASIKLRAEFTSLWDGLDTDSRSRIIVIGATNRPDDIDKAILRRMPRQFEFKVPDAKTRELILSLILKGAKISESCSLRRIAAQTAGYSGSDLRELCKACAMVPLREYVRGAGIGARFAGRQSSEGKVQKMSKDNLRAITESDFLLAMEKVRPTGHSAKRYAQRRALRELFDRGAAQSDPFDQEWKKGRGGRSGASDGSGSAGGGSGGAGASR